MSDEIDAAVERIFQAAYGAGPSVPTLQEMARSALLAAEQRGAAAAVDVEALCEHVSDHLLRNIDGGEYPENLDLANDAIRAYFARVSGTHAASARLRGAAQRARELMNRPITAEYRLSQWNQDVRELLREMAERK